MTSTSSGIRLGFQVGSGTEVTIPLKHLAICGQTQEAGKTTALEALITRAGVRALTFVTKRGEGSFGSARRVEPYFREQADWQFVASILEASRGEKLKFERAWIIRASRGAQTLADVQHNVREAMKTAKGLAGDVYLTLDAYLEQVVPAIARVRWASSLQLAAGVNAMDLTDLPSALQHLVIRSSIDWMLGKETDTVLVIPEAWKFLPQGRGTPVKQGAAAYIRQGAALRNYLWLDSQDLGGIEKEILRSVAVWILGVQREANEIKRTLANIPATVAKPSAADLATLELGQFYACWGRHAIKTYAQPAWLDTMSAEKVARGELSADLLRRTLEHPITALQGAQTAARRAFQEDTVTKTEADRNVMLPFLERVEAATGTADRGGDSRRRAAGRDRARAPKAHAGAPRDGDGGTRHGSPGATAPATSNGVVDEATYQAIKARLIAEAPQLLKVLVDRPELEIAVERQVVTADGTSTKGRVARLIAAEYLAESKRFSEILRELERTGTRVNNKSLSVALQELVVGGFLTKESVDRYKAVPEMRVRVVES
jgi:hypothetical protein